MTEYIAVNSNNLITSFVWSGLLDRAKCGELLEIIKMCSVEAVPIEVLQEIKQKTYKLHPVKRGDNEYANGAYDGMCRVIDIVCDTIDAKIKEITNEECD